MLDVIESLDDIESESTWKLYSTFSFSVNLKPLNCAGFGTSLQTSDISSNYKSIDNWQANRPSATKHKIFC